MCDKYNLFTFASDEGQIGKKMRIMAWNPKSYVNGIIEPNSDKMGLSIHDLWGKYFLEITIKAGGSRDPRILRFQ